MWELPAILKTSKFGIRCAVRLYDRGTRTTHPLNARQFEKQISTTIPNLFPPPHVRGSAVNDRLSHRNAKPTRIVIADEQPIFCQGLRTVIETQPDLRVRGSTSDGADPATRTP